MSSSKPSSKKPVTRKLEKGKGEIPVEFTYRTTIDIASVVQKIKADVGKGAVKYYTPYTLAQSMNIKVSDAKRALKEAVKLGLLKLYSKGRRSPVFVPVKQTQ